MKRDIRSLAGLILLALLATPETGYGATSGAMVVRDIIAYLYNTGLFIWAPVAVLMLVIGGLIMVAGSSENASGKAKTVISGVVAGSIMILLGPIAIDTFYQTGGIHLSRATLFTAEVVGIIDWISAMAAMIGILMITIAVFRAVASFGDENAYTTVRTSIAHVAGGLLIIAANAVITYAFTNVDGTGIQPNPLIEFILSKTTIVLGLMSLAALSIIVYAGFRLVTNFGNEEVYASSKSLILRALSGLVVIIVSLVMVDVVLSIF